jgi:hypothetical protein
MLDTALGWGVILLPTFLSIAGVVVSINVPKLHHRTIWYVGLIVFGVGISGLTRWQQYRADATHRQELKQVTDRLDKIDANTKEPPRVQITNQIDLKGLADLLAKNQVTERRRQHPNEPPSLKERITSLCQNILEFSQASAKEEPAFTAINNKEDADKSFNDRAAFSRKMQASFYEKFGVELSGLLNQAVRQHINISSAEHGCYAASGVPSWVSMCITELIKVRDRTQ